MKALFALFATIFGCMMVQTSSTMAATVGDTPQKPMIAVSTFENKTGGSITREIARYTEKGHTDSGDYETKRRVSEIVPSSGLQLPDTAADVATNAVSEALTRSGRVRVMDLSPSARAQIGEVMKKGGGDWKKIGTGMDYLIVGSINSYNVKDSVSEAYGVQRRRNTVTVSLSMKLFKVSNQEVIASKTMQEKVTRSIPQGTIVQEGLNDDWEELLCQAIDSAVPKFIDAVEMVPSEAVASSPAKMVSFEVKSIPMGADVEYNHSFVGNTPCVVRAPAVPGVLRITLAGYEPWEKRVTPAANMRISPKLQKSGKGEEEGKRGE